MTTRVEDCIQRMIELAFEQRDTSLTCGDVRAMVREEFGVETFNKALDVLKTGTEANP